MYNLSVVNIVEDQYKDTINAIAEAYGCGPNNLSVKLQDAQGNIYWGCHSPWKPEHYAEFTDPDLRAEMIAQFPEEQQAICNAALAALYERLVMDGNPMQNFESSLNELGLTRVSEVVV